MKSFHEDRGTIYTFPSGTLALVCASGDCWKVYVLFSYCFTCPRDPLLVLETKGQYVGSRSCYDDGEEGDLVELDSACGMAMPVTMDARHIVCTSHCMHVTLNVRQIECTSHCMYITLNVRHIECTSHFVHVTFDVRHIGCTSHRMHVTWHVRHNECTSH